MLILLGIISAALIIGVCIYLTWKAPEIACEMSGLTDEQCEWEKRRRGGDA